MHDLFVDNNKSRQKLSLREDAEGIVIAGLTDKTGRRRDAAYVLYDKRKTRLRS
jgi:hypothetical protein